MKNFLPFSILGIDFVRTFCYIKCTYKLKGDDKVSPRMGQKLTDNPKDKRIEIRMDKETVRKMDCLVSEQNSDRSKIIRQGIEIQYEQRNKK